MEPNGPGRYVGQNFDPDKWMNAIAAALGFKAGANHYRASNDPGQAAAAGLGAFVRWMVWMIALGLWFFGTIIATWAAGNYLPEFAALMIAPFTLGVTWCRNVDYCLFKRGWIYKLYAPIARMVEWAPTWALYALLAVPLVGLGGKS